MQSAADNNTATQKQVNDAKDALQKAVDGFNSAKITVDYSALSDLIETEKN